MAASAAWTLTRRFVRNYFQGTLHCREGKMASAANVARVLAEAGAAYEAGHHELVVLLLGLLAEEKAPTVLICDQAVAIQSFRMEVADRTKIEKPSAVVRTPLG